MDLRWEDQEQVIVAACSSLIAIVEDHGLRVVQFSHFSVKEFLTSDRLAALGDPSHYYIDPESAHTVMAQACIAVLFRLDYSIDEENMKIPLIYYAATHFGSHAESGNVISWIRDGINYLLDAEKPHFAAWFWPRRPWQRWTRNPQPLVTVPLYYIAELGFLGMVQHLISKRPQDINAKGGRYGTPFHAVAARGHVKVAQLLVSAHYVDADARNSDGQTTLHLASSSGCLDMVHWPFRRDVDVNGRREKRRTILDLATPRQLVKFARKLLVGNSDVRVRDNNRQTPLHLASQFGHCDIMR
jgi:hypothetical protein